MGLCTKRRIYVIFLLIVILQIVTTGARQIFDFLGPLWALILTNFFNIVFCIFGFFGGYTRRKHFLITYIVWSVLWAGWNVFILCLYIPVSRLEIYKSSVLSIGTGGFSWWETRAPGCVPDWASETRLVVTNCSFDPRILECAQAGIQVYLAVWGLVMGICLLLAPPEDEDEKVYDGGSSLQSSDTMKLRTVPAYLNGGTGSMGRQSNRNSSRMGNRGALKVPSPSVRSKSGANGDTLGNSAEDRLRPMTPRKVKRRSARSIQSQRYGPQQGQAYPNGQAGKGAQYGEAGPSGSGRYQAGPSGGSHSSGTANRNSLRSNGSRRSSNHRNSKRKPGNTPQQHFISPVNRLMQQQQLQQEQQQQQHHLDSETSHDEPRFSRRDQGHVNPVYLGPASTLSPPPPPRPPSARSSYSNYHPARLPPNTSAGNPNIFNLNQNVFTNPAFDSSNEYNDSQLSNNTAANGGYYEDDVVSYHPMSSIQPNNFTNHGSSMIPPVPRPGNSINPLLHPPPPPHFSDLMAHHSNLKRNDNLLSPNGGNQLVYPLAHSPVSQDSFPMWGIAQAQVPTQSPSSSGYPALTKSNRPYISSNSNNVSRHAQAQSQQPINSETVI